MKIAVITDDGKTISAHFGRARHYLVFTAEEGVIVGLEQRDKTGHHDFAGEEHAHHGRHDGRGHGFGRGSSRRHASMMAAIEDCDILLARGMGQGAYLALKEANITPITTEIKSIEDAVQAYLMDVIVDMGGEPTTTPQTFDKPEGLKAMLQLDLEMEKQDVEHYRTHAAMAEELGLVEVQMRLEEMAADEAGHARELRRLLKGL